MPQTVHLTLTLKSGGAIKGDSTQHSLERKDTIECSSFDYSCVIPLEGGSSSASGRRQHSPVTITKRVDKSTSLLFKAMCEFDTVEKGEFKFYRPSQSGEGNEEHFYSVVIENGNVSGIRQYSEDALTGENVSPHAMEEVKFTFQKITWTYEIGGIMHTDSWSGE